MFKKNRKRTGRTGSVEPQSNRLQWEHLSRGWGIQAPQAIANDGTIYSGASDGVFYAFAPDGSVKWKYRLGNYQINAGPAIAADGSLHAFAPNGTLKWVFDLRGYSGPSASPVVGEDGVIYVSAPKFYAINPDGTLRWKYDTGDYTNGPAAIDGDGTIYFPSLNYLYALKGDGTLKWRSGTS